MCSSMAWYIIKKFAQTVLHLLRINFDIVMSVNLYQTIKFNDTSRYFDDIFTIDNPEFAKHIPDIYPTELHNKTNTSFKENSFLD